MSEQTRYARVSPSKKDRGTSVKKDISCINVDGIASTRVVSKAYKPGTIGEYMNEGEMDNHGSVLNISDKESGPYKYTAFERTHDCLAAIYDN